MSSKDQLRALTDSILADLSIDSTTGAFSQVVDAEKPELTLYEKNLPAELPVETVKAVKVYDTRFVAASARACSELANGAMATNKDLASATHTLSMFGKDSLTVTANRDGALDVTVTNRAVDPTAGELKKVFHDFKAAMKEASAA